MAASAGFLKRRTASLHRRGQSRGLTHDMFLCRNYIRNKGASSEELTRKHGQPRPLPLVDGEEDEEHGAERQHGDDHGAVGGELGADARDGDEEEDGADGAEQDAQVVDARELGADGLGRDGLRRQQEVEDGGGGGGERAQQPEEGAPGDALGEGRGQKGPHGVAQPDAGPQDAHEFPALLERRHVRDDHHGEGHGAARRDAADGAEGEELRPRAREGAEQVAEGEQAQGRDEHALAAKDVREPAVEHLEGRVGDERRRSRPRDGRRAVEVAPDGGEDDADGLLVDEGDEQRRRQRAEDDEQPGRGQDVGLVVDGQLRLGHDALGLGLASPRRVRKLASFHLATRLWPSQPSRRLVS